LRKTLSTTRFAKVLKTREVVTLGFGAMIGWSWVLMTGVWLSSAGTTGTLIAFTLGGLAICLIGLTYSELASAMPKAGGEHVYTHRALGPNFSFLCTWALLFSYINVCLFEAVALPAAVEYLFPEIRVGTLWNVLGADVDIGFVIVGVAGTALVTWANYVGIKTASLAQTIVTVLIVLSGLLLISGATLFGEPENTMHFVEPAIGGIMVVLIMVPGMLVGFDVIPQSAEEIDLKPQKIGLLLIVSVICAVIWYVAISGAVGLAIPYSEVSQSNMATADAASNLWGGSWAGVILVLGGIGGILTSWNAFIVGASRVIFALSESGRIPKVFSKIHPKYQTPYVAILSLGILSAAATLFGRTILVWLINTGSFAVTVAFLLVAISFLVLRKKEPEMERPFKVTHPNLVGYGAVFLSLGLLSAFFPWSPSALTWPEEWSTLLIWTTLGLLILFYSKKNSTNQ
jgi:APA family basic amino acid/polyamine antiporter|tara:strand:- start:356 stop:1729 length:1374 start_codon:yes stop_codon:yes gene_type:complete